MSKFMHSKILVICLHSSHLGFPEDRCMVCVSRISSMVSWILALKHNQILIPKTYKKITFYGKKDLVDAIKLRTLRLEYYSELLGWALNTIPNILVREKQRENWHRTKSSVTREAGSGVTHWQAQECQPSSEAGRGNREPILPWSHPREHSPADTLTSGFQPPELLRD